MPADAYAVSDALDVPLESARAAIAAAGWTRTEDVLDHPGTRHALVLSRAWRGTVGVPISKLEACEFQGGSPAASPALDRQAFLAFAHERRRIPRSGSSNVREYERSLADAPTLRRELLCKLLERHAGVVVAGREAAHEPHASRLASWLRRLEPLPLGVAYREIVGHASGGDEPRAYFAREAARIADEGCAEVNPLTQHRLYAAPFACRGAVCLQDARRSAMVRDFLFMNQAALSTCVHVETAASDLARPCVIDALLDEAARLSSKHPMFIMSADRDFLAERREFFHYATFLGDAAMYACAPRAFASYINVGATPLPVRVPCARAGAQTLYYAAGGGAASQVRDDLAQQLAPPLAADAYTLVADTIEACNRVQALTRRLAYVLPQFVRAGAGAGSRGPHPVAVGHHPDSAAKPGVEVAPDDAGDCRVYVNVAGRDGDANHDGLLECALGGGTPVVGADAVPEPLAPGRNCVVYDAARADACLAAAAATEPASTVGLLHNEDVFRWLCRALIGTPCPVRANRPASASLLLHRFLVLFLAQNALSLAVYRPGAAGGEHDGAGNTVLAIDNRRDPGTVLSVAATLCNLKPGWRVCVFCTPENADWMRERLAFAGADVRVMANFPTRNFFIEQYNRLLKSQAFWDSVPGERVLTVQNDGLLIRPGLEDHDAFAYDYAGAPWREHPYLARATGGNLVGNGGLSVRNVAAMRRCVAEHRAERLHVYDMSPLMSQAEDCFFASHLPRARVCPRDAAARFALEQDASATLRPLGVHAFWRYQTVDTTVRVFEMALQESQESQKTSRDQK